MTTFTIEQLQRMVNWYYMLERTDPGLLSVEDKDTHCDLVAAITAMRLANESAAVFRVRTSTKYVYEVRTAKEAV